MPAPTTAEAEQAVAAALRAIPAAPYGWQRTAAYRTAAHAIVDLRTRFTPTTGDGTMPDWTGRSREYKRTIRCLYDDNLPPALLGEVAQAVRYHVGNELRRRLTVAELHKLGLAVAGPAQRALDRRARPRVGHCTTCTCR